MEKKQIIINNLLINYLTNIVTDSEFTIVFLHGWRSEAKVWGNILSDLKYASYAIDLPGFGESQKPQNPFTLNDFADTVFEFINKLNLQNIVLIGHSNGGAIAIKYVTSKNSKIEKLILVDSAGLRKSTLEKGLKTTIAKMVKPIFSPKFMQPLRKKIYESMGSEDYVAEPMLKETYINMISEDLSESLKKISVPTLLIWGDKDKATPLADGEFMHQNISNSELKIIENANHFSFLQNKELFEKYVQEFLARS